MKYALLVLVLYGFAMVLLARLEAEKEYSKSDLPIEWYTKSGNGERICVYSYKKWEFKKKDAYQNYYGQGNIVTDVDYNTDYLIYGHRPLGNDDLASKTHFDLISHEYTDSLIIEPVILKKEKIDGINVYICGEGNISIDFGDNDMMRDEMKELLKKQNELSDNLHKILEKLYYGKIQSISDISQFATSVAGSMIANFLTSFSQLL